MAGAMHVHHRLGVAFGSYLLRCIIACQALLAARAPGGRFRCKASWATPPATFLVDARAQAGRQAVSFYYETCMHTNQGQSSSRSDLSSLHTVRMNYCNMHAIKV